MTLRSDNENALTAGDDTTKETDMIVALDFADRIRALEKLIGGGTSISSNRHLADNIPSGCGVDAWYEQRAGSDDNFF